MLPMIRTTNRRRLVAAATLLTTFVVGACSDDDPAPVASASDTAETGGGADAVSIVDFTFKPADLEIEAGTTVTFTNEDDFAHTATAKDKSFDTGNLDKDGTAEHTFDEPGTFPYLCAIHNSMTGTITVS